MASRDETETEPAPEGALTCQHCGGTWGGCDCVERATCDQAGAVGHFGCGWCDVHGSPRFACGCLVFEVPVIAGLEAM